MRKLRHGWLRVASCLGLFCLGSQALASVSVTVNGTSYTIPQVNEKGWGQNVTSWIQAISLNTLQPSGGTFTLSADIDFGSSFGLKVPYIKSKTANIAASGVFRLANTDSLVFRNSLNTADLALKPNAATDGVLQYNSVDLPTISSTHTLTNKTLAVGSNHITGSVAKVPQFNASTGDLEASAVTNTQLSYLDATSSIQTQLNAKQATGNYITALTSDVTASGPGSAAATVVQVGGSSNTLIHSAELAANAATNLNTFGTIVKRDGSGNFTAGTITAALTGAASGNTTITPNQFGVVASGSGNALQVIAPDASTSKVLISGGASANPTWGLVANTNVTSGAASSGNVLTADGSGGAAWSASGSSPDQSYEMSNLGLAASVGSSALTIALKQKDGSTNPGATSAAVKIGFRSSTLTSGAYNQRQVTGALSLVVPSTATLGHASAQNYPIYIYAIDNAGTVELAVSGSRGWDETSYQSTTAISAAATNRYVLYSTSARSNVPVRLIGVAISNQTTAGTWAAVPTTLSTTVRGYLPIDYVRVHTSSANGSTGNRAKIFTTVDVNQGSAITYATNATNADTFTINELGVYNISYTGNNVGGGDNFGITKNTAATTGVTSASAGNILCAMSSTAANNPASCSWEGVLVPGDVIRAAQDGAAGGGAGASDKQASFTIFKRASF